MKKKKEILPSVPKPVMFVSSDFFFLQHASGVPNVESLFANWQTPLKEQNLPPWSGPSTLLCISFVQSWTIFLPKSSFFFSV